MGEELPEEWGGEVVRGLAVETLDKNDRRDVPDNERFRYDLRNSPSSSWEIKHKQGYG